MKVLITGSAGFIGFHLSKALLKMGFEVVGIDSMNNYYDTKLKFDRIEILYGYSNYSFFNINIVDRDELFELFDSTKFDLVINLAAQAGVRFSIEKPHKYVNSNLIGFVNILEACRNYKVDKLLFASSSSVYGNNVEVPFSENQNTDKPESLYAATKKSNELMAYSYSQLYGIKSIGLRFFTVYGPMGRPDMAYFSFTNKIYQGEEIQVFNEGNLSRDFTYIDDVIDGIINLIDKLDHIDDNYKVYNLGNNAPVRLIDFINTLEKSIGKKANLKMYPMQPGDVLMTCADIEESRKDFNYSPETNIEVGLGRFVDWYTSYYQKSTK
ncbi:NAD-dependent epimerase/dehydratase family protein [Winogradskyella aurantiaca]|uniref:NAD-dependent epimerase/dehydratase family protein n=1 Tax=Winogradskyella aurantiaca TaxID=2219558 RepID=UPI000E1CCE19|nr:NAD-dependent epimerase/dehydratase family protein [Winogradskyella aurantiaca]